MRPEATYYSHDALYYVSTRCCTLLSSSLISMVICSPIVGAAPPPSLQICVLCQYMFTRLAYAFLSRKHVFMHMYQYIRILPFCDCWEGVSDSLPSSDWA
jgi:hypothetical protein